MVRGGERVKEFLRPFVDSREWDFCVIWKLGDDPSRYLPSLSTILPSVLFPSFSVSIFTCLLCLLLLWFPDSVF